MGSTDNTDNTDGTVGMDAMNNLAKRHAYGFYGPGSVAWKVGREIAVLLGGSRAVLMQLAHPLVAMGVSAHSSSNTEISNDVLVAASHHPWGSAISPRCAVIDRQCVGSRSFGPFIVIGGWLIVRPSYTLTAASASRTFLAISSRTLGLSSRYFLEASRPWPILPSP